MWNRLTRTAPPSGDVLDLAAIKQHLRVEAEDTDPDAVLTGLLAAAMATVEGPRGVGIALLTQAWQLGLDCFPSVIEVPLAPVQSVVSVKYIDPTGTEQTLASNLYLVDTSARPARIVPIPTTPWPAIRSQPGAVKVSFIAGFGANASAVPGDLILALKMLIGHWYENREAVIVSDRTILPTVFPLAVETFLSAYRPQLA